LKKVWKIFEGDKYIWIIFVALCIISLIEVFSASSRLSYHTGDYWLPLRQHAEFLFCGLIVVLVVLHIPYKWFQLFPFILIPVSLVMLAYALAAGHGVNGAARWVELLGIKFQPSELAKMAMVIFTASTLSKDQRSDGAGPNAFWIIIVALGIFCLFILPENFSTAALLFLVIFVMMYIGRVQIKKLLLLIGGVVGFLALLFLIFMAIPQSKESNDKALFHRGQVWVTRIENFFDESDKVPAEKYDISSNEQVGHARIAVATSSFFGKAPGNSVQRDFLSEAESDFIFAIIIEEMGLFGGIIVVFLYICLLFRVGTIANECEYTFPGLLVLGIALMMTSQALVNMLVAVGVFPVTGQPLPLISKGGTSTLINCAYIGMILSVSRSSKMEKNKKRKNADASAPVAAEPGIKILNEDTKMQ
jgi:cell division protein FtsW